MKFLVDAQLPRRLCRLLTDHGHDCSHTLDLPQGNRTTDEDLSIRADEEDRALITKDGDFILSFLRFGKPARLLYVSTGNISNDDLIAIFAANIAEIAGLFGSHSFIELSRNVIVAHD